jgi:hypothetical protein
MSARKTPRAVRDSPSRRDVVTIDDLAPRHDVRGGSGRQVFGAQTAHAPTSTTIHPGNQGVSMATKKSKDLAPAKSGTVKGGKKRN